MITLLPEQAKKEIRNLYRRRVAVVSLFFFAWLVAVGIIFLVPTLIVSNEKKAHAQQQLAVIEKTTTATATTPLRDTVTSINKKVGLFTQVKQKTITDTILDAIFNTRPKGISITDIKITNKEKNIFNVMLVGVADNRDTLEQYVRSLQGIAGFSEVTVPLDNYLKGETLPMHVSFQATL